MCAALSPLQTHPLSGGKFRFSLRPIPCFYALSLQARQGLLFSFCLFFCPSVQSLPPAWMGWLFLIPVCRFSRIRSQLAHTALTGLLWSFGGHSPTLLPKPHTGPSLEFSPKQVYPSPVGGWAGYRTSWVRRICPARSQPGHSGPTGPVWSFGGVVSLSRPLTGHKSPHRDEFGFHRLFLVPFFCGSPAS